MKFLKSKLKRIKKFYPYENCSFFLKLQAVFRAGLLKIFNKHLYREMSLVNIFKNLQGIKNDKEFLDKYYKIIEKGFDELWNSKPRETKEQVESIYNEHDSTWRFVYLSKYDNERKNHIWRGWATVKNYPRNSKILDYGCGVGMFSNYLYQKGYKNITLADVESGTLRFAQKAFGQKFKYIKIKSDTPLKENYDIILLIDVLAHVFNPFEVTKHILDHLNKGGLLIVFFEKGIHLSHLARAVNQREKTLNYINSKCKCLKEDEVFIKL